MCMIVKATITVFLHNRLKCGKVESGHIKWSEYLGDCKYIRVLYTYLKLSTAWPHGMGEQFGMGNNLLLPL